MSRITLPLLQGDAPPAWPVDAKCHICSQRFCDGEGVAYISCGTVTETHLCDSETEVVKPTVPTPRAFFAVGFHGKDTEVRDSVNADIVDDLNSDQFDLTFCSLGCVRQWFHEILDDLEAELSRLKANLNDSIE